MKPYEDYVWPEYVDLAHDLMPVQDMEGLVDEGTGIRVVEYALPNGTGIIEPILLDEIVALNGAKGQPQFRKEKLDTMARRLERLTSFMVWQALRGKLLIEFPTGGSIEIKYPPKTVLRPTISISWDDSENADPMLDVETMLEIVSSHGFGDRPRIIMNSVTADVAIKCKRSLPAEKMADYFVEINDQGYMTEPQQDEPEMTRERVKYLRDGEVWIFPNKEKPGFVANMPVEIPDDEEEDQAWVGMGPFVGEYQHEDRRFLRVSATRVPVITRPDLAFCATTFKTEDSA
jgi:hypothetical protein